MSEAAQLSDLYPLIMANVPDCPSSLVDQQLQQAQREFCRRTEAWIETLAPIDLETGVITYALVPSFDCAVKRILNLWTKTSADITAGAQGTLQDQSLYTFSLPSTLTLDTSLKPASDTTDGLVTQVVLLPNLTQTGTNVISKEFMNEWAEALIAATLWKLMLMPKQRWSNPELGMYYRKEYMEYVTRAMAEVRMAYKNQPDGFEA